MGATTQIRRRNLKNSVLLILALGIGNFLGFSALGSPLRWSDVKQQIRRDFPTVSHVSTAQLSKWMKSTSSKSTILMDVRTSAEYNVSHLKHAQRALTMEEAKKILHKIAKEQRIVLYCSVGYRSSKLADQLQKAGYTNVFNLDGSIFQWAKEGRPLYHNGKVTTRVHPYDDHWGQLLNQTP